MVDARGAQLDREAHARTVAELVAVQSQAETGVPTCGQHDPRLVLGEGVRAARLTEHVDPAGVRSTGRKHLPGDQIDVLGPPVGELRRHHVGAEKRCLRGELGRDTHRPRLVLDAEPVAALDLDGGGALCAHLGDSRADQGA